MSSNNDTTQPSDQDEFTPPSWAEVRSSQEFRVTGTGLLCRQITNGHVPPVLTHREKRRPHYPAFVISHKMWEEITTRYPDMHPGEDQMGNTFPARYFRDFLGEGILRPAADEGVHSFACSSSSYTDEAWHVAFVPVDWMLEVRRRWERDGAAPSSAGGETA